MQSFNYKTFHLNLPFGALNINAYLLYCTSVIRDNLLDTESDLKAQPLICRQYTDGLHAVCAVMRITDKRIR